MKLIQALHDDAGNRYQNQTEVTLMGWCHYNIWKVMRQSAKSDSREKNGRLCWLTQTANTCLSRMIIYLTTNSSTNNSEWSKNYSFSNNTSASAAYKVRIYVFFPHNYLSIRHICKPSALSLLVQTLAGRNLCMTPLKRALLSVTRDTLRTFLQYLAAPANILHIYPTTTQSTAQLNIVQCTTAHQIHCVVSYHNNQCKL